ncbi:hypothetical protein KBY80_13710 [Synechococcus sp. JJ3a-Johnson]|uniref:hypothetical protein n=1 Tax=Synechococcus sp. JJ3a-Johnson TaxID=2823738 RepID=UPI0020CDEBDC|nr:hypothetical protein [Synechococcus sp. JJ3a-Johnson]MCP9832431.1 hypothetical protein [Synechococcus sp. JJ3a-Johnson]
MLVLEPASTNQKLVSLGAWAQVGGLADAVRAAGLEPAPPHQNSAAIASLKPIPRHQTSNSVALQQRIVAELGLSWRYGPSIQSLDPLAQTQLQHFERLMQAALGFEPLAHLRDNHGLPDLDLSVLSLG